MDIKLPYLDRNMHSSWWTGQPITSLFTLSLISPQISYQHLNNLSTKLNSLQGISSQTLIKSSWANPTRNIWMNRKTKVTATPAGKQRQNGLCKGNWHALLRMSRGWLASNLPPSKFLWIALKRTCEVSNYVSIRINNHTTT